MNGLQSLPLWEAYFHKPTGSLLGVSEPLFSSISPLTTRLAIQCHPIHRRIRLAPYCRRYCRQIRTSIWNFLRMRHHARRHLHSDCRSKHWHVHWSSSFDWIWIGNRSYLCSFAHYRACLPFPPSANYFALQHYLVPRINCCCLGHIWNLRLENHVVVLEDPQCSTR